MYVCSKTGWSQIRLVQAGVMYAVMVLTSTVQTRLCQFLFSLGEPNFGIWNFCHQIFDEYKADFQLQMYSHIHPHTGALSPSPSPILRSHCAVDRMLKSSYSLCLSVSLSVCLSVSLSLSLSFSHPEVTLCSWQDVKIQLLSLSLSVCLSVCLPVSLSLSLSVPLSVFVSLSLTHTHTHTHTHTRTHFSDHKRP